ncbi:MAG: SMC-Scp complex subunit ScpB [Bacteroidota bacterium]|jgi:segregation and condensation protein B
MTIEDIMLQCESLIFGSNRPLNAMDIEQILKETSTEEDGVDQEQVNSALEAIVEKYASDFYPFEVKQIGGGYQFLSKKAFYPTLSKLNGEKFTKRLSTASLETLAIIAYRQPITKGDIEHIRGVSSDYSVQKLLEKELIVISGRMEDMVGKPLTYSTSKSFMDYLGLNTLDELPKLNEILQQDIVVPTEASEALPENNIEVVEPEVEIENSNIISLAVSETGELISLDNQEDTENEDEKN